jgi:Flp pilus assembly protein TadD
MSTTKTLSIIAFVGLLLIPVCTFGADAQETFEQGKKLVQQGDFEGAMQAFAAAARADRSNTDYLQNYAMVRQVIMIQNELEKEIDLRRWEQLARALHSYYISEKLYDHALKLDQRIHKRVNTAGSAALLAETQLAMNLNEEVVQVLSNLPADRTSVVTESLEGIALARLGRKADAVKHAKSVELNDAHGPGVLYCVARLQAATGDVTQATTLLTRCFEQVPPSQLIAFKEHAKATPEFAALASTPEFERSLETESKVKESSCSGGSSCAGCPMRNKCNKSE